MTTQKNAEAFCVDQRSYPRKSASTIMVEERNEELVGKITHYFGKIEVAIVELSKELNVGDTIHIKGSTTDFEQKVDSMQIEHENIEKAKKGDVIGLKVKEKVREGDEVYKVLE